MENLRDFWIRKIVENNPDIRGFLGFDYSFIFNPETDPINCGGGWELFRISPSPYVKFIDFINNSQEPIRIESITYQSVENNPYKLTVADQRSQLFQSSSNVTEKLNISIKPENHLLIPIELGFNTEPAKESYQLTTNIDKRNVQLKLFSPLQQITMPGFSRIGKKTKLLVCLLLWVVSGLNWFWEIIR